MHEQKVVGPTNDITNTKRRKRVKDDATLLPVAQNIQIVFILPPSTLYIAMPITSFVTRFMY